MIPVPQWREYYNPLAGLTVSRLNAVHAPADRGQYAAAQWLYRFACQADVTIQAAIARRPAFLDTDLADQADSGRCCPALAAEQIAALREAYNGIENLRDATRHLATAIFNGFAILDKVPADRIAPERLDPVPAYFWIRMRGRGCDLSPRTLDSIAQGNPSIRLGSRPESRSGEIARSLGSPY